MFFKGSKGKLTTTEWKIWCKFEFSPHIITRKKKVFRTAWLPKNDNAYYIVYTFTH